MRILHLASWYPDRINRYNGDFVQRHIQAISLFMPVTAFYVAQHGHGITVDTSITDDYKHDNLTEKIVLFHFKKTGLNLLDKLRYNRQYYKLYKKIIREYIEQNTEPSLIHVHVPMKAGVIARWIKKKYGIPYIVSEHSSSYYDYIPDNYFKRSTYYRNAVKKIFCGASGATTVSKKLGERLQEIFELSNLSIIHNTVDTRFFYFSQASKGKFRFIHASTMNHPKNVEGILRSLAKLKARRTDWEFVMLGWDSPELKRMCTSLFLDEFVKWKGIVSYEEVADEMKQSSALVMFSRYENFPCTIIEALCCGLPVISTDVGGIPEAVNTSNGILIESEKEDQLLEALNTMIDNYALFNREKIAEDAQGKFNYYAIGKNFVNLYESILKRP